MLSIILVNSKIYDRYLKYDYFFNWFEDHSNVAVCIWNKQASADSDIDELAPQLFDLVKNVSEWNAYIVDEPFDSIAYMKDDFENLTQYSINPYERANKPGDYDPEADPLMRLVYFLGGRGYEQLKYIKSYGFRAVRPNQIFLLTPRIFENLDIQKQILQTEIEEKNRVLLENNDSAFDSSDVLSLQASDFWSRYEYPANCRFLVFNMPDMFNVKHEDSWFLFWLATVTLVINTYDSTELGAYKLYQLDINLLSDVLESFVNKFHMSLKNAFDVSQKDMENEIEAMKMAMEDTSANHQGDCAPVYVTFPDTDFSKFNCPGSNFGNTKDNPELDTIVWKEYKEELLEETNRLFKAITRGKNEAVDAMNRTFKADLPLLKNQHLSRYDAEDIADELDKSEIDMLKLKAESSASRTEFDKREAEEAKTFEKILPGRVMSKTYLKITLLGVLVCLMGFVPFIVSSAKFSLTSCVVAVLITVFTCAVLFLASFVALRLQRKRLGKQLEEYNDSLAENLGKIGESAQIQSAYLTHLLNYMQKYQMLVSGKIEEKHIKRIEELTQIHAKYEDALEQCRSIAGLCHIKLVNDESAFGSNMLVFMPDEKIYLHEDTDGLRIPLNSTDDRLTPPFPFVESLCITEEKIFESCHYYRSIELFEDTSEDSAFEIEKGDE